MPKPKILIVFYSRKGSTEDLARAVAAGAEESGAEVRLRRVREFVSDDVMATAPGWKEGAAAMNARHEAPTALDAEWADAIIFGTPTRFGGVAAELKAFIDSLGGLWFQGKLNGKVGAVFGSTSSQHGGNEATLLSIYPVLSHLGLIIVPLGYSDPSLHQAGTPYGATFISRKDTQKPGAADIAVAKYQGTRVANIASRLAAPAA